MDTDAHAVADKVDAFDAYLAARYAEAERRVAVTSDGHLRVILKTQRAELDVIRREYREMFGLVKKHPARQQ